MLLCGSSAVAQLSLQLTPLNAVRDGRVEAELIAQYTALVPGETARVGLRLEMDDGWHTYWKNPGDAGLATSLEWDLPEGFVARDIDWPAPHFFAVGGLASYGYEGEIVLPIVIEVPEDVKDDRVTLRVTADWLVCEKVCEAGAAVLTLNLPIARNAANVLADPTHQGLFAQAQADQPEPLREDAVSVVTKDGRLTLVVTDTFPYIKDSNEASARFFPEDPMAIDMTVDQTFIPSDYASISVELQPNPRADPPEQLRGVLVYRNGDRKQIYEIDTPLRDVADSE